MSYNQAVKKTKAVVEAELENALNEWAGVQRMLAFVLKEIGKPVHISKKTLDEGISPEIGILLEEDADGEGFTFSLEKAPDEV